MYIKIRKLSDKAVAQDLSINVSKKSKIQELREIILKETDIPVQNQKLFYKGKQLVDDHCLFDYGVQLNDVIQLMIKVDVDESDKVDIQNINKSVCEVDAESKYYKIGDNVDVRDIHGAWFEGKITRITKKPPFVEEKNFVYHVTRLSELERGPLQACFDEIRPRAYIIIKATDLIQDQIVLANYNIDDPKSLGYWYDCKISNISGKSIRATILFGSEKTPIDDCQLAHIQEIFKIEEAGLLDKKTEIDYSKIPLRKIPFNCLKCKDNPTRKCKECGCRVCSGKNNWEEILLCDECDNGYHIGCLTPPLTEIPQEEEWYCPECKTDENEIVKAGDKLKHSKKKSKMPSAKDEGSSRDWGKGMACVGRTKECTIVSKDHIGPIPGVEVGTCWKFRFQASEAGIHRPLVAGIHGRESSFAYSIVLSGGYEDDIDNGDEFFYTGSGGRDLSGNKRVNEQSCDQVLTRMNKALAMNCNAKFNPKDGAEAEDWKGGKAVRVIRNFKLSKHSKYAPKDGNRYDGVYKIVKYYPERGISGFIVWRYFLRRDDPAPAPWHKNGKEFDMIYPPGYLEAQANKEKEKKIKTPSKPKRGAKRVLSEKSPNSIMGMFKKIRNDADATYKLEKELSEKIENDTENDKLWSDCKEVLKEGKTKFLAKVEETFQCICCQDLVYHPITTPCHHNICKTCLRRSFSAEMYSCPYCRSELGKEYKFVVNEYLTAVLQNMFPGYEATR